MTIKKSCSSHTAGVSDCGAHPRVTLLSPIRAFGPLSFVEKKKLRNEPNLKIAETIVSQEQMRKFGNPPSKNEPNFTP